MELRDRPALKMRHTQKQTRGGVRKDPPVHVETFEQDGVIYLVDQVHCDVFRMHENAEHDEPGDVGRWDPDAGRVILHG